MLAIQVAEVAEMPQNRYLIFKIFLGVHTPDPLEKHASHAEGALHTCHEPSANVLQKLLNKSTF